MQIVINIDENVFTRLFDNGTEDYTIVNDDLFAIAKSIRKGVPLPKGHGDLIDRKELLKQPMDLANYPSNYVKVARTIIEADKEI